MPVAVALVGRMIFNQEFGVGNWAEIRENIGGFNAERRPVDLKDKWTNLKKRGDV